MKNHMELSQGEIEQKLISIISRLLVLDASNISASSRLQGDLPFDSLGVAEFMMEVEDVFDVDISEQAHAEQFPGRPVTVGSLAELILAVKKK